MYSCMTCVFLFFIGYNLMCLLAITCNRKINEMDEKKLKTDEIFLLLLSIHWTQNLLWKQEVFKENIVQVSRPQKCVFMHMHE